MLYTCIFRLLTSFSNAEIVRKKIARENSRRLTSIFVYVSLRSTPVNPVVLRKKCLVTADVCDPVHITIENIVLLTVNIS